MNIVTFNGIDYDITPDVPNVMSTDYIGNNTPQFIIKMIIEYIELRVKHNKLEEAITKFYTDELHFNLSRKELDLLKEQLHYMREYLWVLERRCNHYDINVGVIYKVVMGE